MISNNEELAQTLEAMGYMYRALASLRTEVLPKSPQWFALMAEGPVDEIRRLEEQINEYSGRAAAEVHESDAWLAILGPARDWPEVPASIVTALLEALRQGVQAVAEFASTGQQTASPTGQLARACDFRITTFRPGGTGIGLRIPDDGQLDGGGHEGPSLIRQALGRLLQVAEWVGSEAPPEALEVLCPDPHERRVILEALKPLVPRPHGDVERLEVSGRAAPRDRTISLTAASHKRIDQAIDALAAERVEVGDISAVPAGP
jgi:hypothetical protein